MKSKLSEIRDRIQTFKAEPHYEPNDVIEILQIIADLAEEVERVERNSNPIKAFGLGK